LREQGNNNTHKRTLTTRATTFEGSTTTGEPWLPHNQNNQRTIKSINTTTREPQLPEQKEIKHQHQHTQSALYDSIDTLCELGTLRRDLGQLQWNQITVEIMKRQYKCLNLRGCYKKEIIMPDITEWQRLKGNKLAQQGQLKTRDRDYIGTNKHTVSRSRPTVIIWWRF